MEHLIQRARRANEAREHYFRHKEHIRDLCLSLTAWAGLKHQTTQFVDTISVGPLGLRTHYGILMIPQPIAEADGTRIMARIGIPDGFVSTHLPARSVFVHTMALPEHGNIVNEEYVLSESGELFSLIIDEHGTRNPQPIPLEDLEQRIALLSDVTQVVTNNPPELY